jgi:competence protein ComEA
MGEISRPQLAVYVAAAIAIALLGARYVRERDPGGGSAGTRAAVRVEGSGSGAAAQAVVHVAGAVRRPGVYRMRGSQRVADAVARAGGPTRRADLSGLNLAARLEDGRQILVPARGQPVAGATTSATSGAGGSGAPPSGPISLNTATPEQLDALDGIGPTTAAKIVEYRQQHGGFRSVAELDQVPGIGEKRLAALRDQVQP